MPRCPRSDVVEGTCRAGVARPDREPPRRMRMSTTRKLLWGGGVLAGVLLIVLGAVWIYAGVNARSEVHDTITREQIVGSPDMSPTAILPGLEEAGIEGD